MKTATFSCFLKVVLAALALLCWQTSVSFGRTPNDVTLELDNQSRFAIRFETVPFGLDGQPDWESGDRQVLHLDHEARFSLRMAPGTHLIILSNPTGAWTYIHTLVWNTTDGRPWILRSASGTANTFYLKISPVIYKMYTLERPNRGTDQIWLPWRDNRLSEAQMKRPNADKIGETCRQIMEFPTGSEVAFWSNGENETPQFFRRVGPHLCGVGNRPDYYYLDGMFTGYACETNWKKCAREPDYDLMFSNLLLTNDAAYWLSGVYRREVLPWIGSGPGIEDIRQLHPINIDSGSRWYAEYSPAIISEDGCPTGYRLHYQEQCIHVEDEMSQNGAGTVRMIIPR